MSLSRLLGWLGVTAPAHPIYLFPTQHLQYPSLISPQRTISPRAKHLIYPSSLYPRSYPSPSPPYLSVPPNTFIAQHLISASISPDPRDPVPNTSYNHLLRSPLISYFPSLSLVLQSCYVSSCLELGNPIADVWMDNLELGDQIADMWTTQVPCLTLPPPDFGKAARDT